MKNCPDCGKNVRYQYGYCPHCGADLSGGNKQHQPNNFIIVPDWLRRS